jgi:hypothetical protein
MKLVTRKITIISIHQRLRKRLIKNIIKGVNMKSLNFRELLQKHCLYKRTVNCVDLNGIDSMQKLRKAYISPNDFENIGKLTQADLGQAYLKLIEIRKIFDKYDLETLLQSEIDHE